MELLGFHVFFLFAVIKSYSAPVRKDKLNRNGINRPIRCDVDLDDYDKMSGTVHMGLWRPDFIDPVRACVNIKGEPPQQCENSSRSLLRLLIAPRHQTTKRMITIPIKFDEFDSDKKFCRTITAKEMSEGFEGTDVDGVNLYLLASVVGRDDPNTTFNLTARTSTFYFDGPGKLKVIRDPEQGLLTAFCNYPKCFVTAFDGEKKLVASKTERFRMKGNGGPEFDPKPKQITANMFKLSYFECDQTECPTKLEAKKGK